MSTDANGIFAMGRWKDENVWDINKQIAKDPLEDVVVLEIDYMTHSYPHCHFCDAKLMYRAVPSWFMHMESQRTDRLGAFNICVHSIGNIG
jgi:isoleucyl-tRNA synthetase